MPKTQVRNYFGVEGIKQIIWNCLKAKTEVIGYSQFGRVSVVGEKFYSKYVEEFKLRKIVDRSITNELGLEHVRTFVKPGEHQQNLDNVRMIPKDKYYVSGDTSIYNNIYAVCWWDKGEIVGIELENPKLVKLQKSIFEMMWSLAEPISKYI
ncbi:MAG: hypothetical protein Q9M91_02220 [Candidatus Dojkabacteria bacterium]|nr:hypothetical protein [Candidatus Dojkabacteria bacterium]MDQ7020640.1 hypothetical protein [Candidatus Dojkabacteria bacterium]